MQSENFDKKIKDSLSQRPPGNEPPAWDRMAPLLDKHMPVEKKDRRRIFFILFLFLLLGGGAFFIWQNNRGHGNDIAANKPDTESPTLNNSEPKVINKPAEKTGTTTESSSSGLPKK